MMHEMTLSLFGDAGDDSEDQVEEDPMLQPSPLPPAHTEEEDADVVAEGVATASGLSGAGL